MADITDPVALSAPVDLTNCDREPIHIPGSIQPHAVLLVLEEPDLIIRQASANAATLLGRAGGNIVGEPLSAFMGAADLERLQQCVKERSLDSTPYFLPSMQESPAFASLEATLHRCKGALILELESWPDRSGVGDHELLSSVRSLLTFSTQETPAAFCQRTAEDVRRFTGFDRVMVYRFDRDLSGQVIAEAKRDDLESYLDLHYPASDIPQQARNLLRLSRLRLVPDVHYTPVPLLPAVRPDTPQPLDMSFCITRSMSPIHVEYLKNMGVAASMSVSIVINDRLWGLVACHHTSPRYVSHAVRSACDFLAHALSVLIAGREQEEESLYTKRLNVQQRLLNRAIADTADYGRVVQELTGNSIGGIEAEGAAFVMSGVVCLKGKTPPESAVLQLADHFWDHVPEEVWCTDRLLETMPRAASLAPTIAGLLAARLSRETSGYLFWFRPEVGHTIKWAGNPALGKSVDPAAERISPRKSFALWQQQVSGRSSFWLDSEIAAAHAMRHSYQELYPTQTEALVLLNAELTHKLDRAEHALTSKDKFLATLSHELRTPLNPALLIASEEADNPALSETARQSFATIRDNVELEARLIDDLLDLSRITHGKMDLDRHPLGLHTALRQTLAILHTEFASKSIAPVLRLSAIEPIVNADLVRVLQILWNVLKNAVKFTPQHGTVTVETRIDASRHLAIVRISDSGVGMTAEEVPRIFEAFSQGDHALKGGSKRFGGLGLGLAITRSLLEAHAGRIAVESAGLGHGSTFTIELPLETSQSQLPASSLISRANPRLGNALSGGDLTGRRVLVLEDHVASREGMAVLLTRRGFEVSQAATVAEALDLVAAQTFVLVISDIGLPDGDGYTFMRELRKLHPASVAIALSGHGSETDRQQARDAGFADLLTKPINIRALDAGIAKALRCATATALGSGTHSVEAPGSKCV